MKNRALKPCPFCGEEATLDIIVGTRGDAKGKRYYTVGCNTRNCHGDIWRQASAVPKDKLQSIIDAWNRRA